MREEDRGSGGGLFTPIPPEGKESKKKNDPNNGCAINMSRMTFILIEQNHWWKMSVGGFVLSLR